MLYFAYGSNLCPQERARWLAQHGLQAGDLRPVSLAWLPDQALSFGYWSQRRRGGALDIRPQRGSVVHGALFEVTPQGWQMLDIKEGVAQPDAGYERLSTWAIRPDGQLVEVQTYRVKPVDRRPHCDPAPGYLDTVLSGLEHWQMPSHAHAALNAAAEGSGGAAMVNAMLVYGTLMRGELRWPAMRRHGVKRVLLARSRATLHPAAEDPPGEPFPAITLQPARHELHGDWVESEDVGALLADADRIETFLGYGDACNLYDRTLLQVDLGQPDGRTALAWAYLAAPALPVGDPHATGCWREARGRRTDFLRRLVQAHGVAGTAAVQGRDADALIRALDEGHLREWDLASASGCWSVLSEMPSCAPDRRLHPQSPPP